MTYCVGIRLDAGLVFMSDSRTNAGLDQISSFRKMMVYEQAGDRFMVLLSAGNLSISQSVREILQVEKLDRGAHEEPLSIWNATSMFDATRVLGSAVRRVYEQDGPSLKAAGIEFNASLIFANADIDLNVQLFVKNLMDDNTIVGFDINDENLGATRSVFLLDPRLYGIAITKGF